MQRNGLEVIALEQLNNPIYDETRELSDGLREYGYRVDSDSLAIRVEKDGKKRFILRATEMDTSDGWHILTVGSDNIEPWRPFRNMADEALKGDSLLIYDHPFVINGDVTKAIPPERSRSRC
jgi:hypothetical protein